MSLRFGRWALVPVLALLLPALLRAQTPEEKAAAYKAKVLAASKKVDALIYAKQKEVGVKEGAFERVPVSNDMTPFLTGAVDAWPGYRIHQANLAREQGVQITEFLPKDYGAVVPGDQLRIEVETLRSKDSTAQVRGSGSVAGRLVCEATLMFTMVDA